MLQYHPSERETGGGEADFDDRSQKLNLPLASRKWPIMAGRGRRNADDALALALAAGKTLRDAATEVGVGERTAGRRWADADFRGRVAALRQDMVARCLGRMADGMTDAADTLRKLLAANSEGVRLGAARALLELGLKIREGVELGERLDEVEQLLSVYTQEARLG